MESYADSDEYLSNNLKQDNQQNPTYTLKTFKTESTEHGEQIPSLKLGHDFDLKIDLIVEAQVERITDLITNGHLIPHKDLSDLEVSQKIKPLQNSSISAVEQDFFSLGQPAHFQFRDQSVSSSTS